MTDEPVLIYIDSESGIVADGSTRTMRDLTAPSEACKSKIKLFSYSHTRRSF